MATSVKNRHDDSVFDARVLETVENCGSFGDSRVLDFPRRKSCEYELPRQMCGSMRR